MSSNSKSEFSSLLVHMPHWKLTDTVLTYRSGNILASTCACIQDYKYTTEVKDIASPKPVYWEGISWPFQLLKVINLLP